MALLFKGIPLLQIICSRQFRQRANAEGTLTQYKHDEAFPQTVRDATTLIYEHLSRKELLERCLGGFTWNNKNFNSFLWRIA
ncbi:hypothetical protein J437_LFUL008891 [Ladona fulva]|uniref:Uncharacterized protein n=1 Tax=Ladona fulva TaxID=123851 RepID=A0A8K0KBQ4_LADFU|nr:hypothetical protein J437_LFUL008891 [Ladona fulva]